MAREKTFHVYILASRKHGTLYIGVTSNLVKRTAEHREKCAGEFTKKYDVALLVYFEAYTDSRSALQRERTLKHWKRDWKIALIEGANPEWRDMFGDICR